MSISFLLTNNLYSYFIEIFTHCCFHRLHLHNINLLKNSPSGSEDAVMKFGFNTTVCCGKIPIDNTWNEDWVVITYLQIFKFSFMEGIYL